jgi:branched-chain amino acid transport system permease protein
MRAPPPARVLWTLVAAWGLSACAPQTSGEGVSLCLKAAGAFVADRSAATQVRARAADGGAEVEWSEGGDPVHRLECRFEPGSQPPVLAQVVLDGHPVEKLRLFMLKRWLRLPAAAGEVPLAPAASATPPYLAQQVANGLVLGCVYALVAMGFALAFGISGIINLAYGAFVMVGALFGIGVFAGFDLLGVSASLAVLPLAALTVLAMGAVKGGAAARWVFMPLSRGSLQAALIGAVGLGMAIEEAMRLGQGARDRWLSSLSRLRVGIYLPDGSALALSDVQLVIVGSLAGICLALWLVLTRSDLGRRLRATAEDPFMARMLGIDTDRMVIAAFGLGGGLAAFAGLLAAVYYGEADISMGHLFGFKALTAALLGGIGSIPGALAGGLLIGLIEALWAAYGGLAGKDVAVFATLVLVLVLRPEGIFGRR